MTASRVWQRARPLAGGLVLLATWELAAVTVFAGRTAVPTVNAVAATIWNDRAYGHNLGVTLWEALRGYAIGNGLALACAVLCIVVRPIEKLVLRFAVATYCIPTIAVGPLFVILFSLDSTKVLMSALSVFFVTLVGLLLGLHAASAASLDLVHVCGGGAWKALVKVRLRAAVPLASGSLAIAAPAAILGAMIGDFLGGDSGLGVVMVNSESSLQVARTWGVAVVATVVSGALFGATILAGRTLAPGHGGGDDSPARQQLRTRSLAGADWPAPLRAATAAVQRLLPPLGTIGGLLLLWVALIKGFHLNPYFAKTPGAVWSAFTSPDGGAAQRSLLFSGLGITLRDAALGYGIGTGAALLLAGSFVLFPVAGSVFMPMVVVFRAVPLVAMTPVLALVFGNGIGIVAAVAAIVTLVPSVVVIYEGLRSAPPAALDLFHALAASSTRTLRMLRVPYSLPSLFAAAKIAVPGSVLGAVIAEWLVASSGLGRQMVLAVTLSNFVQLWGSVAVVTAISVLFYSVLNGFEESALARIGR